MSAPQRCDDPLQPPHGPRSPCVPGMRADAVPCGIPPDPLAPHSAPPSSGLSAEVQPPGTLSLEKGAQCPRPHSPAWAAPCRVPSLRTHKRVHGAACPAGRSEHGWAHIQGSVSGSRSGPLKSVCVMASAVGGVGASTGNRMAVHAHLPSVSVWAARGPGHRWTMWSTSQRCNQFSLLNTPGAKRQELQSRHRMARVSHDCVGAGRAGAEPSRVRARPGSGRLGRPWLTRLPPCRAWRAPGWPSSSSLRPSPRCRWRPSGPSSSSSCSSAWACRPCSATWRVWSCPCRTSTSSPRSGPRSCLQVGGAYGLVGGVCGWCGRGP